MSKLILDSIVGNFERMAGKQVTLGFDGFIDIIYKVIRSKDHDSPVTFFKTIGEFGGYISGKGEKNFSLELEEVTTKIGGNMPIMANALAQFGSLQNCVGPLGYPTIHPLFKEMSDNCRLFSFENPGLTKALEFNENKILLAEIGRLNSIEWDSIKAIVGLERLTDLFLDSDLVCLLNWSELDNSTNWWKGILSDVLPARSENPKRAIGFFDLADCSKRSPESIMEALSLIRAFAKHWNVVLSLNLNEAVIVHDVLTHGTTREGDIEGTGAALFERLGIDNVVIHYSKQALSWNTSGLHRAESFYLANPAISTGAGDNFNAGYCAGLLMGLNARDSLILGHALSNYYMSTGRSPSVPEMLETLADNLGVTTGINTNP
jgi:hypothetical protein